MTELTVSIEDVSMLEQIKQAISMLRGVSSVTLKRRRKTSMDRAIEDIEQGRVYKYDSLDDLIKEIEGWRSNKSWGRFSDLFPKDENRETESFFMIK